jgi:hypothetical protein
MYEREDGDTYSAVGVRYGVAAVVAKKVETMMSVMTTLIKLCNAYN